MKTMNDKRRGATMLVSLVMVTLVGIGSGTLWVALRQQINVQSTVRLQDQSRALAEGGLAFAEAQLAEEGMLVPGETSFVLGEGTVTVFITQAPSGPGYRVESTGRMIEKLARGITTTLVGHLQQETLHTEVSP